MRRTLLLFMLLTLTGAVACGEAVTPTPPIAYPAPDEAAVATQPPDLPPAVAPQSDLGTFYSRVIMAVNGRAFPELPYLLHPEFELVEFGSGAQPAGDPLAALETAIGGGSQTISFGDELLEVFPYSDVAARSGAPARFADPEAVALLISHHWGNGSADAILQIVSAESGFAIRRVFYAPTGFSDARADFVFGLTDGVARRDYEALANLMGDPMAVDVAGVSGFAGGPAGVAAYLRDELLPTGAFTPTLQTEPDPALVDLAPPAPDGFTLYGSGWGLDGQARAILTITYDGDRERYQWSRLDVVSGDLAAAPVPEPGAEPGVTPWPDQVEHLIDTGEWLLQVARCYGTTAQAIQQANPGLNPNRLLAGETIAIPDVGAVGPVIGPPCVVRHTVQAGEDVESIAAQYGADAEEIRRVNGFGALQAGQTLLVPRARP